MHLDSRHTMLCGGGEASHRSNDMTEFSLVYLRVLTHLVVKCTGTAGLSSRLESC